MDKASYLKSFQTSSQTIAAAARRDPHAPLPSCPEWTMTTLLGHLATIYISVARYIHDGTGENIVNEIADLHLTPEYEAWYEGGRKDDQAPPDIVTWFEEAAAGVGSASNVAAPAARCWTWYRPDQTVGFWLRRMAQETSIHAWDTELAQGDPGPIDSELAADGVDEALFIYQAVVCRSKSALEGRGESYHLHRTDGPGEWLARFEGTGMTVRREHARGDVALRGPASDLVLYLWHRIPADRLEIHGDSALIARYFELVPPD